MLVPEQISIRRTLQDEILRLIGNSFAQVDLSAVTVKIEIPPDLSLGDYATPVAMENAKIFRQAPQKTAEQIIAAFEQDGLAQKQSIIKSLTLAGPGFLNIRLQDFYLNDWMLFLAERGDDYSKAITDSQQQQEKILLEYVSANPTGPMNIVSARAAAIGSCLYNIWRFLGIDVASEYYINDYGNQVDILARSVATRYLQKQGVDIELSDEGYQGDYIYDIADYCAQQNQEALRDQQWRAEDLRQLAALFHDDALQYNIDQQKKGLADFGVVFDQWFSEKSLHVEDKPLQTLELLQQKEYIYENEGKIFFASTRFGDDKDRVVRREDGRPTYFMADIAYHWDKIQRGSYHLINIWGPDHHGYIPRLKGAIQALTDHDGLLEILIAQQVNLSSGGEQVKMSKRKGNFTTLQELLEQIPRDVARFFFIMRDMNSPLDFDLELAKKQTMDNPVYYIQYAHARIHSVFRENQSRDAWTLQEGHDGFWDNLSRRQLILAALRFADELVDTADSREIHRLPMYLKELAGLLQSFYQKKENRVLGGDAGEAPALLALMGAVRTVLGLGLGLLGISAPEKM